MNTLILRTAALLFALLVTLGNSAGAHCDTIDGPVVKAARDLADMYFFETVVRLHRTGEGEPYSGLKPSGTPMDPSVVLADKALAAGDARELVQYLIPALVNGMTVRFNRALEAKKEAGKSVDAGREFVEAYVQFVHYAEQLFEAVEKPAHEQMHRNPVNPEPHH